MGFQINQVVVSGNLTRNPEVRQTPGGTVITSFSVAHNERRKNQSGEWEDRAHFFDVTVFGGQGDWLAKNAGKGDPITVSGQLEWRSWEDKQTGAKRSAVEILARDVVLGQRGGGGGGGQQGGYDRGGQERGGYQGGGAPQQGGYQGGGGGPQQGGYNGGEDRGGYQGGGAPQGGGYDRGGQDRGGYSRQGSDVAVDTSDFAPAPQRGGLPDPGEDDIPF